MGSQIVNFLDVSHPNTVKMGRFDVDVTAQKIAKGCHVALISCESIPLVYEYCSTTQEHNIQQWSGLWHTRLPKAIRLNAAQCSLVALLFLKVTFTGETSIHPYTVGVHSD